MRPDVLIACASDWYGIARLPRVLRRAGGRVTVLCPPDHALTHTRFVDEIVEAPGELADFVAALERHTSRHHHDWVIIADDPLLAELTRRRDEAWIAPLLPVAPGHEWACVLASKADFCRLAAAAGLPVATSRTCVTADDAQRAAAELGLPMILKQSASFGGKGVSLARAAEELAPTFAALAAGGETVVAQRFVAGEIGNSVALFARGELRAWMSAFKVRTVSGPFGPSSARRFMTHPDVEPMLRRLGALSGYHGFAALDWVLGSDGRLHIIELNARPVPTIHMGSLAGVSFERAVADLLAGRATCQRPWTPRVPRVHPMFPEDVYRAGSEGALELAPIRDLPFDDPALVVFHLRALARAARAHGIGRGVK